MSESTTYAVPPVERALKLLRHIGAGDPVINVSRSAAALGINRTTLIRLLHTLEAERFIEKRPGGVGWRLGIGAFAVAAEALAQQDIVRVSTEVLQALVKEIGLSAHLAVLDELSIVYLLRLTPDMPLVSNVRVGSRLPAHATNMGRAILAQLPEAKVRGLFAGVALEKVTAQTPTTVEALLAQLAQDRAAGLAWSAGYFETGVSSVAAPVFDATGHCAGAINVTGHADWFGDDQGRREAIGRSLARAAAEISSRLGFNSKDRKAPWPASISSAA
ncbi:IclR family transcriptional regulator [Roseomonas gilardii subsp. gilardii]|uniref:IclR family transcriptional regulator n=1 Tax=Roseomonas gilardii TaxID=257708 RepID=UPI001FF7CB48|nr:IclR family transcriptional regulator [Roseomonas gilardii]UPG73190.1 IclR family transcriptional regulator [Roseomonas gilardii subsp. gilardii]